MRAHWAKQILDEAKCPNTQVLWHIGHHLRRGQSVDEAYPFIRGHVRHLHFTARTGEAEVTKDADNQRTFQLLAADGFPGFFSVEYINPPNPDETLALHIAKYNEFMKGVR